LYLFVFFANAHLAVWSRHYPLAKMRSCYFAYLAAILLLRTTAHPTAHPGNPVRRSEDEERQRPTHLAGIEEYLPEEVYPPENATAAEGDDTPSQQLNARQFEQARAIYFITNDPQNSVVALPVNADGTLCQGTFNATGGCGANGIDGTTGQPAVPDSLFSQGAITVVGRV
jgi:hypothetical protein